MVGLRNGWGRVSGEVCRENWEQRGVGKGQGWVEGLTSIVLETSCWMLSYSVVSTGMAVASPPARVISRATVVMVDCGEFGSGGKGVSLSSWAWGVVDLAATTT